MKPIKFLSFLVLAFQISGCASTSRLSRAEYWAQKKGPASYKSAPEPIGASAAGCLNGGVALYPDGPGFALMRPSRNRFYGHPRLISFIEAFARTARQKGLGTVLIGDLSQPRGGPMNGGHRSHQTGLDVDVWFHLLPTVKGRFPVPSALERESLGSPSLVSGDQLDRNNWNANTRMLLQIASERAEVERIFVNPVIKRELCIRLPASEKFWLRKIRPWWGHDSHFHVRLKCPAESTLCVAGGDPLPEGDGCDETLNWWFSDEAVEMGNSSGASPLPVLPKECEPLFNLP